MYDHKKRTAEMIAVMQAYVDGKAIEVSHGGGPFRVFNGDPCWTWSSYEYRIATIPDSINWDHVAPEWKWMARDVFGDVRLYQSEPRVKPPRMVWSSTPHVCAPIDGFASYTRGTVDWKDSLVRRPE